MTRIRYFCVGLPLLGAVLGCVLALGPSALQAGEQRGSYSENKR